MPVVDLLKSIGLKPAGVGTGFGLLSVELDQMEDTTEESEEERRLDFFLSVLLALLIGELFVEAG